MSTRRTLALHIADYYKLTTEKKYDEAFVLFCEYLDRPTSYGVGDICLHRIPLLEALFPQGVDKPCALSHPHDQLKALHALGLSYIGGAGQARKANQLYPQYIALAEKLGDAGAADAGLGDYAKSLRQTGSLRQAEDAARRGLLLQRQQNNVRREAVNLYRYGMGLAQRGIKDESQRVLQRAIQLFQTEMADQDRAMVTGFLAQCSLWMGHIDHALRQAQQTWEVADALATNSSHLDLNGIFKVRTAAARMIGEALMQQNDLDEADTWIGTALSTANLINMVEETLPSLQVQAEIARRRGHIDLAHHALQSTWELAETGQYVLYQADSYIILARLYEDTHEINEAIHAAQTAYRLSWCDGPPFAYQRGLEEARIILQRLGGAIPEMPAYDPTRWPPLLEIDL